MKFLINHLFASFMYKKTSFVDKEASLTLGVQVLQTSQFNNSWIYMYLQTGHENSGNATSFKSMQALTAAVYL